MGLSFSWGFCSSNKMHTASSLREDEVELITGKVYRRQGGKMCLKAGKKKKTHTPYNPDKRRKMEREGKSIFFLVVSSAASLHVS